MTTTPHDLTASEDTSFKEFMDKTSEITLQTSQVIKDLKTSQEKTTTLIEKVAEAPSVHQQKLELEKFSGDIMKWKGSWVQFEAAVH